jgi:diacylglycerol kinase (ATP)
MSILPSERCGNNCAVSAASESLVLVVNANARAGDAATAERATDSLQRAGARVRVARTANVDQLVDVLREAAGRRVVLLGGDGGVHAAANSGVSCPLALLPAGHANNIARALGIPVDLDAAAALAVNGTARGHDLIEATGPRGRRLVVEGLSIGLHAVARGHYHARNSGDRFAAVRSAAWALRHYDGGSVDVQAGEVHERLVLGELFVANLRYYSFGLRIAPHADPHDGALDFIAFPPMPRRALPATVRRLRAGTHLDRPEVRTWQAAEATLVAHGSPVIADTVDIGPGPVRLAAARDALSLVTP